MGTVQVSRIRPGALFKTYSYPHRGLCTLVHKSISQWVGNELIVEIMYVAADGMFYAQKVNVRYHVDHVGSDTDG